MKDLLNYLDKFHPLGDALQNHLLQVVQTREVRKKDFLLRAGRVCESIYFIREGLLRCFYVSHGNEVCSWFMTEGDVAVSVESFFCQKPSYENIEALESSVLYSISHTELQFIYDNFPEFNYIGRLLTEKYYTLSEQRLFSMRMQRAPERYTYLMNYHPHLIRRVPATHLASYLGITLETLSRIKSRR
jgi:CRP-like cAMP-binding protein